MLCFSHRLLGNEVDVDIGIGIGIGIGVGIGVVVVGGVLSLCSFVVAHPWLGSGRSTQDADGRDRAGDGRIGASGSR